MVDGAQDPNVVVAPGGGANEVIVAVNHLHELADAEWHKLDFISLHQNQRYMGYRLI